LGLQGSGGERARGFVREMVERSQRRCCRRRTAPTNVGNAKVQKVLRWWSNHKAGEEIRKCASQPAVVPPTRAPKPPSKNGARVGGGVVWRGHQNALHGGI